MTASVPLSLQLAEFAAGTPSDALPRLALERAKMSLASTDRQRRDGLQHRVRTDCPTD